MVQVTPDEAMLHCKQGAALRRCGARMPACASNRVRSLFLLV
jgi:hypothetical protein